MNFTSIINSENEVDVKYRSYLFRGTLKKMREDKFENLPYESIEGILKENSFLDYFQKCVAKIKIGKKEYKITKELLNETKNTLEESVEPMFNKSISITEKELNENLYDLDFVVSKLGMVFQKYLNYWKNLFCLIISFQI